MSIYADVPLADGGWFTVEFTTAGDRSGDAVTARGRSAGGVDRDLRLALARVARAVRVLLTQLWAPAERPGHIEVERHELGAIVARTGGEVGFRVAVYWNRE